MDASYTSILIDHDEEEQRTINTRNLAFEVLRPRLHSEVRKAAKHSKKYQAAVESVHKTAVAASRYGTHLLKRTKYRAIAIRNTEKPT